MPTGSPEGFQDDAFQEDAFQMATHQDLTGTLSFSGDTSKRTNRVLTATLSFLGTMFRGKLFTAVLSFVGEVAKGTGKSLSAVLSFATVERNPHAYGYAGTAFSSVQAHPVLLPAVVARNDLLLIWFAYNGPGAGAVTDPLGWTILKNPSGWRIYAKIAVGNEGGTTVNIQTANASDASAQARVISGALLTYRGHRRDYGGHRDQFQSRPRQRDDHAGQQPFHRHIFY
jgi:hypothetical protein